MKIKIMNTTLSCFIKYMALLAVRFNKKLIFSLFIISFLGACTSPTALLGPAYTLSTTGNIFQTGFSYGSSELVRKHTGKTPIENIKQIVKDEVAKNKKKNIKKKTLESGDFFILVSNRINKTSDSLKLSNQ